MNYNGNDEFKQSLEQAAINRWQDILSGLGIHVELNKHMPCPNCGGTDRFRFDDKNKRGDYFCSHCDPGDGWSLIQKCRGCDFPTALEMVANQLGMKKPDWKSGAVQTPEKPIVGMWQDYWIPNNAGKKDKKEYTKLNPKYVWEWCEKDSVQWYLIRSEWVDQKSGDKRKAVMQCFWNAEKKMLEVGSIEDDRPLLGTTVNNIVLIVEGERTYDSALKLVPAEWSVVTWVGGSKAHKHTDWTVLKDKTVYFWPDNDEGGIDAMHGIAHRLRCFAKEIIAISPPKDKPEKWDLTDALLTDKWDKQMFIQYVREFSYDLTKMFNTASNKDDSRRAVIRPLGIKGKTLYCMPSTSQEVIAFGVGEISEKFLTLLADYEFWSREFRDEMSNKINWKYAGLWLIQDIRDEGPYNPLVIRGSGCWYDAGRYVLHTGNRLIVDGKSENLMNFPSEFVYEARPKVNISLTNVLTEDEIALLHEVSTSFSWENSVFGEMYFGWLMLATVSGALSWRPHIWLTGSPGSGKSTLIKVITEVLDGMFLGAKGDTTEAFIRQQLRNSAFPVIFEDNEADSKEARQKIERNIALARQASSETKTYIGRGSASGDTFITDIRSMFCFSSVDVALRMKADRDRVAVLSLKPPRAGATDEWKSLEKKIDRVINMADLSQKILYFAYSHIDTIKHNAMLFSDLLSVKYNKRFGDQFGTLIAGNILRLTTEKLSKEDAEGFLSMFDLSPFETLIESSQEQNILEDLLQQIIRVDSLAGGSTNISIGAAIEKILDRNKVSGDIPILHDQLLYYGIKVDEDAVYFCNKSKQIANILRDVAGAEWHRLLERIPGAEKTEKNIWFGAGLNSQRAVRIPATYFMDDQN